MTDAQAAQAAVEEAQKRLAKAQEEAAEAGAGLAAVTMQNVPDMEVEVLPDQVVTHDEKEYGEGDTLTLPGPRAVAMLQMGHVTVVGTASAKKEKKS